MELHPSGFVETNTCDKCNGPRYIRSQPSRSSSDPSGGPGLAQGPVQGSIENPQNNYYLTEWSLNLPYKNLMGYTKEIENQWGKLDNKQKDIIANSLSLFVMKNPDALLGLNNYINQSMEDKQELISRLESIEKLNRKEAFSGELTLEDLFIYFNAKPDRVNEVLNNLRNPSEKLIEQNDKINDVHNAFKSWLHTNKLYVVDDTKTICIFLIMLVFFLIGITIGYNFRF